MAMEKMEINTEVLEELINYVNINSCCDLCPFVDDCHGSKETTCAELIKRLLTTPSIKDYTVEVNIDGCLRIPVKAASKKEAVEMALNTAHQLVKDCGFISTNTSINFDNILER